MRAACTELGADPVALAEALRAGPFPRTYTEPPGGPDLPFAHAAKSALSRAEEERVRLGHAVLHPLHLLLAVLLERPATDTTLAPLADVLTASGLQIVLVDLAPAT